MLVTALVVVAALAALVLYDVLQRQHAILRTFPVVLTGRGAS